MAKVQEPSNFKCTTVILGKLMIAELVKKFQTFFMVPEDYWILSSVN
jgi:hypothetical protein